MSSSSTCTRGYCAAVTYCPTHPTRLQERCPACYVDDPFLVGVLEHTGHAVCWHCEAFLSEPRWPADGSFGVEDVVQLQAVLLAAMHGHAPALCGIGSLSAGEVVALENLLQLLIDTDGGEPPFVRGAASHWRGRPPGHRYTCFGVTGFVGTFLIIAEHLRNDTVHVRSGTVGLFALCVL